MKLSLTRSIVLVIAPQDEVKQQTWWIARNTHWQHITQNGFRVKGWFVGVVWARRG